MAVPARSGKSQKKNEEIQKIAKRVLLLKETRKREIVLKLSPGGGPKLADGARIERVVAKSVHNALNGCTQTRTFDSS